MKRFLVILCFFFSVSAYAESYPVTHVVDGDTIDVKMNGKVERVRFLCVNTPESVHRDKKQNVPMGKVASDHTKKRLSGKSVELEFEGAKRGVYGRLLAYVFIDGNNFCLELVRQGLSPYYIKYGESQKYDDQFKEAERLARQEKLNIWGDPNLSEKYLRLKSKWGQPPQSDPVANGSVISSKNSDVFHRPECKWAKKITAKNRVEFISRDEAMDIGKRPCKTCKP